MNFIFAQLHNQFLSGGLMLLLSGSLIALMRKVPERLFYWAKRCVTVEVQVTNADPLFDYVTFWLDSHPYSKKSRQLCATIANNGDHNNDVPVQSNSDKKVVKVLFSPAPGSHVFFYGGKPIWLERQREGPPQGDGNSGAFSLLKKSESYHFTILGRDQSGVRGMISEIVEIATKPSGSIRVFHSGFGYWQSFGSFTPRKLSSVILPQGQAEGILEDAQAFLAGAEWYHSVGIPWHRGYLLHGLPGTGKSSLVAALAGELGMDLYLLNISGAGMGDERLSSLMADVRPGTIVLMEDVDCTFPDREKREGSGQKVTLSGLLNCLDGIQSRDGSMIFMTTNMLNKLDSALIRPGRVDVSLEFGYATADQVNRLRDRIVPGLWIDPALFAQKTMADVQQYLLGARKEIDALDRIDA